MAVKHLKGGGQGYGRSLPEPGKITTQKPSSHRDAGKHPGETDRMVGGRKGPETGPSSPRYLPK